MNREEAKVRAGRTKIFREDFSVNVADIETFLMLVKTRNITKTAENLFVSQPTVSHRLKLLEEELGVSLLSRKKGYKKVELTAKGEEFIPIAQRWLSLMQETRSLKNRKERLYLSIGCTNTLNSSALGDLYRELLQDSELNLNLNISTHYSYELYELVENHAIDVGFVYHHLQFKNILSEPVLREKMYLVQEKSGAIPGDVISPDELNRDREICLIWEGNYQIWHEQVISKGQIPVIEVDIYDLLEEMMALPGRWTIAPETVVEKLRERGNVTVARIGGEHQPPERITYRIRHREQNESRLRAARIFDRKMRSYFEQKGWDYLGGVQDEDESGEDGNLEK